MASLAHSIASAALSQIWLVPRLRRTFSYGFWTRLAHTVPTICTQLHITGVIARDIFPQLIAFSGLSPDSFLGFESLRPHFESLTPLLLGDVLLVRRGPELAAVSKVLSTFVGLPMLVAGLLADWSRTCMSGGCGVEMPIGAAPGAMPVRLSGDHSQPLAPVVPLVPSGVPPLPPAPPRPMRPPRPPLPPSPPGMPVPLSVEIPKPPMLVAA